MISAVLVCFNEAKKLETSLKSLENFADEIIVIDLGSSDDSIAICKKYQAKVYQHEFVPYVEEVRNFAVLKASGDWLLVLDPDEAIGEQLKNKLKQVASENKFSAVNIPRKNIFFGKWIAHTNWWPDRHVRFFKKGQVEWNSKIHLYPKVAGETLNLEARENLAIIHSGYDSITEFIERQNRYSEIEAQNLFLGGMRFSLTAFFWKPLREFLVRFIKHKGFLDGFHGFSLVILMMIYQMEVMVKLWEKEQKQ